MELIAESNLPNFFVYCDIYSWKDKGSERKGGRWEPYKSSGWHELFSRVQELIACRYPVGSPPLILITPPSLAGTPCFITSSHLLLCS